LRDLVVWQKAHQFVLAVYSFTARFPKTETYGLSIQRQYRFQPTLPKVSVGVTKRIRCGF